MKYKEFSSHKIMTSDPETRKRIMKKRSENEQKKYEDHKSDNYPSSLKEVVERLTFTEDEINKWELTEDEVKFITYGVNCGTKKSR